MAGSPVDCPGAIHVTIDTLIVDDNTKNTDFAKAAVAGSVDT